MSVALLANENFPAPAVRTLRSAGVDVVAVREAMPAASDREVIAYARREGRWILTFDRDYGELVFREGLPPPPAILFFRQEPFLPEYPADLVLALLSDPGQVDGCMVVIGERNIRRKRFPRVADE
jgi:predicted nuclease of predicted toxin-antitoxin system